ncbi:unnamed protein product [Spodoptera exigua]|nr:unnamed protein product [Spodoptera exigua]
MRQQNAELRASESKEHRAARLEHMRQHNAELRTLESKEHRAARLEHIRQHNAELRASESKKQRAARLEHMRQHNAELRASESREHRAARLEHMRQHNAELRASESREHRAARLEHMRQHNAELRASESKEHRAARKITGGVSNFNVGVQSPVLVVELNLDRIEGTQLRALGLLAVYGFNVTYEVRAAAQAPGPTSCSAIECRLLGHCYASHDYREFYCSCFDGYSGADCGVGPLCPTTSNMCKNGGTCRQMGPAAVRCICAPGYTGDLCEAQVAPPECGIEECAKVCKDGTACDCNPKDTDALSARFETRLQVVGLPNENISDEIAKQLTQFLKASNITLEDDVQVLNTSLTTTEGIRDAWVRVWSSRREAPALRAALARLASARTRLLPTSTHFEMHPALSLHKLVVNQRPEVWEGSEFILTCMAYGSPNMAFTWYKDSVKINFNGTTRDIWTRTVSEDALGRRMSVLGVTEAERLDSGKWSCAADDAGRRRCRALRLTVLRPPEIRLVPSTLTVNRGDNVTITCLAGAGRVHGALGFSWARERTLLPMAPGREVWEDLFPAGSVLKLYNVQFTLISMGYSWGSVSHVSRQYGAVLRSLPTNPGEGEPPLTHAVHMLNYLMSPAAQPPDRYNSTEHLLNIYDNLLKHPDAFLDEEKIFDLQNAVVDTAGLRSSFNKRYHEFTVMSKPVLEDNAAHFDLQPALAEREEWAVTSAGVELVTKTENASVVTALYHDLGARLPSLKRFVEYNCSSNSSRSGRATQYTIASQQIQLSVSGAGVDNTLLHTVTLLFTHSKNYSAIGPQLACGSRSRSSPRVWSTHTCELRVQEQTYIACRCRGLATIALFTVDSLGLTDAESDSRAIVKITVSLGSAMCLVAALLQLLSLVVGSKTRLPVLLRAATAATHSAAMLTLLECDTKQVTQKLPPDRREYVRERARVVRHTLVLLFTTTATQIAGVAYAQPGEKTIPKVVALSVAALANGLAMLICYVICDEECLRAARRLLTLSSNNDWHDSPEGDTSLSLYIRQGREMECRGAVGSLECSSSHVSPANTYWRATPLQSPLHRCVIRRGSSGACVADIVRCVEYKQALLPPRNVHTRTLCDLIPIGGAEPRVSRVCVELGVLPEAPQTTVTDTSTFQPSSDTSDISKANCTLCAKSTPDLSATSTAPRPIKSCLKKRSPQLSWSTSLPSINHESDESNSHLQLVDTQSQTPSTHTTFTQTDKVLHKISHDLDFLLNRTPSRVADNCPQQIEEAPT